MTVIATIQSISNKLYVKGAFTMLQNIKKRNPSSQKGFTIIEVMIVLAIAGLIMLVVFLAVPALQRNSRNTTIKNDASALAAGFSEYASNNDGGSPASPLTHTAGTSDVKIGAASSSQAVVKVNGSTVITNAAGAPGSYKSGTLWWQTGVQCNGSAGGTTPNARGIVVFYYTEGSGTNPLKCVDAK